MMVLYKNAVLIVWLTNLLPETRTWSTNIFIEIFYCVYEFFIPIIVSLFFCILSSIILKQKGFKDKAIPIYIGTPIISKLFANALSCSGSSALIVTGLF
jgi:type II secretory pathway component PulF